MSQIHDQTDFLTPILEITIACMTDGGTVSELREQLLEFFSGTAPPGGEIDSQGAEWLSCQMSRAIWSAMPNPSRKFVVERLPQLGRNDHCVSGQNCKHKQCCGSMPSVPPFDANMCWGILCETLPENRLQDILDSKRLPDGLIAALAARLLETNPERVRTLIEPHFAGTLNSRDKHLSELLLVLCDAYDALGEPLPKMKVLMRVADETTGEPRSNALQRLATMAADRGDYPLAWAIFADAQRASPDDPALSHLEVVMLLSEGRHAEARERARFWVAKLQRRHDRDELAQTLSWLQDIAAGHDTDQAMAALTSDGLGEWSQRLVATIKAGLARPANNMHLSFVAMGAASTDNPASPADLKKVLAQRLKQMGIAKDQIAAQVEILLAQINALPKTNAATDAAGDATASDDQADEYVLKSSAVMAALEADWHRAWPLAKPFSTDELPQQTAGVWAMPQVAFWVEFLEQHPEAFDSIDILDDVAIAVDLMPDDKSGWTAVATLSQLYARANQLLQPMISENKIMPWIAEQNRPTLRLLVNAAFDHQDSDRADWLDAMRTVLTLNPNDNHGLRELVVNQLLTRGENDAALALTSKYPDDIMPAIMFGNILALYRLGRSEEALNALTDTNKSSPKIAKWLLPLRKAEPKTTLDYGIQVGGDEEAWLYREDMRDIWDSTPGAMAWLKKHSR